LLTPSYALHLGRIMQSMGDDPRETSVRTLFVAGEPGLSVAATRERIQDLWGARMVEFYGCTEASPHVGGFSCPASQTPGEQVTTHLMEDVQIWEVVDAESKTPLPDGERGLTVCTNLNSEASPVKHFRCYMAFAFGKQNPSERHALPRWPQANRAQLLFEIVPRAAGEL
jgi:phenylacetate-CoA ligase